MRFHKTGRFWEEFAQSKEFREAFVTGQVQQGIPFQIETLMNQRQMSSKELAEVSGLAESAISRATNPGGRNVSLKTIIKIAAGLDVAFIGRFVPFSELDHWFSTLSEDSLRVLTFDEENEKLKSRERGESKELRREFGTYLHRKAEAVGHLRERSSADDSAGRFDRSEYQPRIGAIIPHHQVMGGLGGARQ